MCNAGFRGFRAVHRCKVRPRRIRNAQKLPFRLPLPSITTRASTGSGLCRSPWELIRPLIRRTRHSCIAVQDCLIDSGRSDMCQKTCTCVHSRNEKQSLQLQSPQLSASEKKNNSDWMRLYRRCSTYQPIRNDGKTFIIIIFRKVGSHATDLAKLSRKNYNALRNKAGKHFARICYCENPEISIGLTTSHLPPPIGGRSQLYTPISVCV